VLVLADGRIRQLPALAAPAAGPRRAAALAYARVLIDLRASASSDTRAIGITRTA